MAKKLCEDPITKSDIQKYVDRQSDFSFELDTLRRVHDCGLDCEHGGTYRDPVTGKNREFDIRAISSTEKMEIRFSIECKNIRENYPLMLHTVERKRSECNTNFLFVNNKNYRSNGQLYKHVRTRKLPEIYSLYTEGEEVAKSIAQIGKYSLEDFKSSGSEIFDRVSQATNSAYELIHSVSKTRVGTRLYLVLPILVVPDNMLWKVSFNNDGSQNGEPERVASISYFINQEWKVGNPLTKDNYSYTMSHLEVVTSSELGQFLCQRIPDFVNSLPPKEEILSRRVPDHIATNRICV